MFDIKKIIRPNIQALDPYKSARDEFEGLSEVSLDANENPFGFGLNRYPDATMSELKFAFGKFRDVQSNQLIFGNGSDEIIDLLIRTFCEPKEDRILIFTPTFGMYHVCADINNVEVVEQELTSDFQINQDEVLPKLEDSSLKIIFICSPNNPTGSKIQNEAVLGIAKAFNGLVVVDEAYIDFTEKSLVHQDIANLFVLQTFSKAIGLAGVRLGVGIGNRKIIDVLNKVKSPYNVNSLTQKKAIEALNRPEEIRKQVKILISEREKLKLELTSLEEVEKVYPSEANFLLVEFQDAGAMYQQLLQRGIVVRDRSNQVLNTLRLTIGTPEENKKLLAALRNEVPTSKDRIGRSLRTTSETQILAEVNLDDASNTAVSTGVAFFDHMLEQIARHGSIGLNIQVKGDLQIDAHHTIEDTALALGTAFDQALGERKGIERYGFLLPMDDCLAQVAIDFGGRPWLEWNANFKATNFGQMPSEMASHFFKSFSDTARCNLNIKGEGDNDHHKIESIFKAFARAIKMAVRKDESGVLPSTKGIL